MAITLCLNSDPMQHQRLVNISSGEFNLIEYIIGIEGMWNYKEMQNRSNSKGLTDVQSTIQFNFNGKEIVDSYLWIDKYKPEGFRSFIQEVGGIVYVTEREMSFISNALTLMYPIQITLEIDVNYNEKSEIDFQKTLHQYNTKNMKIKKEFKINSYELLSLPTLQR